MKTKIILPVLALALAGCQHMTKESAKASAPPPLVRCLRNWSRRSPSKVS